MNLALLDPFRRQIPDRIDSTLTLPRPFHPRRRGTTAGTATLTSNNNTSNPNNPNKSNGVVTKSSSGRIIRKHKYRLSSTSSRNHNRDDDDDDDLDDDLDNTNTNTIENTHSGINQDDDDDDDDNPTNKCCHAVAFNRRGTYLAVGYASCALSIHDFASRTLSSIVHPPSTLIMEEKLDLLVDEKTNNDEKKDKEKQQEQTVTGTDHNNLSKQSEDDDDDDESQYMQNPHVQQNPHVMMNTNNYHNDLSPTNSKTSSSNFQKGNDNLQQDKLSIVKTGSNKSSSPPPPPPTSKTIIHHQIIFPNGITSITWSRRSRACLLASEGDNHICFIDNTHPFGPDDVSRKMIGDKNVMTCTGKNDDEGNNEDNHDNDGGEGVASNDNKNSDVGRTMGIRRSSSTVSIDKDDDNDNNINNTNEKSPTNKSTSNCNHKNNQTPTNKPSLSSFNTQHTLKRTRFIPNVDILDLHLINNNDLDYFDQMTPIERQIATKDNSQRTMEERHKYALMKMRLDENSNKHKKKKENNNNNESEYKLKPSSFTFSPSASPTTKKSKLTSSSSPVKCNKNGIWYQKIILKLPKPVQKSIQIHPSGLGGLACLEDGSLVLISLSFISNDNNHIFVAEQQLQQQQVSTTSGPKYSDGDHTSPLEKLAKLVYLVKATEKNDNDISDNNNNGDNNSSEKGYFVTCATFDPLGQYVYAGTKCGTLLALKLSSNIQNTLFHKVPTTKKRPFVKECLGVSGPCFDAKIPGRAVVNQIVCCRNGNMIVTNSKDNILRLFETKTILQSIQKPQVGTSNSFDLKFTLQDVISHCKWESCDFSGDGEYIVGGCNHSSGGKYELYLWNTVTGKLLHFLYEGVHFQQIDTDTRFTSI